MNTNICPKTWMLESILVTIFCCMPFGIIGIINASKVSSMYASGNYMDASTASSNAKKWCIIGMVIGLVQIIVSCILFCLQFWFEQYTV